MFAEHFAFKNFRVVPRKIKSTSCFYFVISHVYNEDQSTWQLPRARDAFTVNIDLKSEKHFQNSLNITYMQRINFTLIYNNVPQYRLILLLKSYYISSRFLQTVPTCVFMYSVSEIDSSTKIYDKPCGINTGIRENYITEIYAFVTVSKLYNLMIFFVKLFQAKWKFHCIKIIWFNDILR